ncbi:hypothetical protein LTR08_003161 [Meristemomyces frigidus]|nr:hypothetical protein LTR08_003161 [Meristemomyces frigidus]
MVESLPSFQLLMEPQITGSDTDQDIVTKGARVKVLTLSGRFRPLIVDAFAARVPWDGVESEQHPGSFDFSIDPSQPLYARNTAGNIMVYEAHKDEVVVQLDYQTCDPSPLTTQNSVSAPAQRSPEVENGKERHICCLEVGTQAMLLVQLTGSHRNEYRRVGVGLQYRSDFFEDAAVKTLELV